jgi:hypothetical protein
VVQKELGKQAKALAVAAAVGAVHLEHLPSMQVIDRARPPAPRDASECIVAYRNVLVAVDLVAGRMPQCALLLRALASAIHGAAAAGVHTLCLTNVWANWKYFRQNPQKYKLRLVHICIAESVNAAHEQRRHCASHGVRTSSGNGDEYQHCSEWPSMTTVSTFLTLVRSR